MVRTVSVGFERLPGWIERYDARHPGTSWTASPDGVVAVSPDGTRASIAVPFASLEQPSPTALLDYVARPWRLGVLLVRRGGFATARLVGPEVVESRVGRRHVQGRSKAGGWSQQRFARRRDNQARAAYEAAAAAAGRVLPGEPGLEALGIGGDRAAIREVLAQLHLVPVAGIEQVWLGGLPDPTRQVLADAVDRLRSVTVVIDDPPSR